jgi:hypothetical protein
MQTALSLSTGWVLAAAGSLSAAVSVVQAAATDARARNQPTHELACLQAAAQWGDASGAARARELADVLSLPLANAVARHTESLQSCDGEGLLAASNDYRAIGDRATAADVAAQAAAAFGRAQQRKRGMYAAALARELADACGGLCTPALRTRVGVPLTPRERTATSNTPKCCGRWSPRRVSAPNSLLCPRYAPAGWCACARSNAAASPPAPQAETFRSLAAHAR